MPHDELGDVELGARRRSGIMMTLDSILHNDHPRKSLGFLVGKWEKIVRCSRS